MHSDSPMRLDDKRHFEIIGASFNRWYTAEIHAFVARCELPPGMDSETLASTVVRRVSQFTLGRLVTELRSTGVTLDGLIEFLRKNAGN
jgi:hypothetical protein